jgi:hypothetical protein
MSKKIQTQELVSVTITHKEGKSFLTWPDGQTVEFKGFIGDAPISQAYMEHVVHPIMAGHGLTRDVVKALERATIVFTSRPLTEQSVQAAAGIYRSIHRKSPQMPPPAIKHQGAGPTAAYELIDEQNQGMGFFHARGFLDVYVVETITYH